MNLTEMEKISDFYFEDLEDMFDEKGNFVIPKHRFFSIKHDEVTPQDFESISQFGKIVKNYSRMRMLASSIDDSSFLSNK
jgi:hypothetical protein